MKKFVSFFILIILLILPLASFAVDNEEFIQQTPEDSASLTIETINGDTEDNFQQTTFLPAESCEEYIKALESLIDMEAFGQLSFDVPDIGINIAQLNVEYFDLVSSFEEKGFGQKLEMSLPDFEEGYSGTITDIFNQSFGDIVSDIKLSDPEMPDSFSVEEMMQQSSALRTQFADEFKNNDAFITIQKQISLAEVFGTANIASAATVSSKTASDTLNSLSRSAKNSAASDKGANWASILAMTEGNQTLMNDAAIFNLEKAKEAFDKDTKANTAWYQVNMDSNESIRKNVE